MQLTEKRSKPVKRYDNLHKALRHNLLEKILKINQNKVGSKQKAITFAPAETKSKNVL